MKQKRVFNIIFALLAVMLAILPFMLSFNDLLTRIVENNKLYMGIQKTIVPIEIRMVGTLVTPLGIEFIGYKNAVVVNGRYAKVTWNCIGWQSLLLFIITLFFGLRTGRYTLSSKIETVLIGLIGVFLINLLRITFTVILLGVSLPIFKIVFHDYLAAITTIIFLIGFWLFAYRFILEERSDVEKN
ncbi:exosortase/archaeosortase family protein [Candidatus Gottesmanbacteria bacterium]|nr:exosortase/archaeosortase family protein [Candidatus Gottesmanbacteria bacterium]